MDCLASAENTMKRVKAALNGEVFDSENGIVGDLSKKESEEIIIGSVMRTLAQLKTAYDCGRAMDRAVYEMLSPEDIATFYRNVLRYTIEESGKNSKAWRRFWERNHD